MDNNKTVAFQHVAKDEILVLEPGQTKWDFIRHLVRSREQEEAFLVMDLDDIVRKHEQWKLKLPRIVPFYAVKCNDNETVLKTLACLGASFDCASENEIAKVLEVGVSPDRIIYANPVKQVSHLMYAKSVNVRVMTFDNEHELYKVKENYPTAKLVLRVRCDAKKAKHILGVKFGVLPKYAPQLITMASRLGIELIGISFHVGSDCEEPEVFDRCITIARRLFDFASSAHGIEMTVLDLGGGYPGNHATSIDPIASVINASLDRHFPQGCGVDIIAEPGRYYVASAITVATRVHGIRKLEIDDEDDIVSSMPKYSYFYYVNDGIFGSFNNVLTEQAVLSPVLLEPRSGPTFPSSVWGPTCDGLDIIVQDWPLPVLKCDDWICFEDMGAYTVTLSTHFNGFAVSKVLPVVQAHTWQQLTESDLYVETDRPRGFRSSPITLPTNTILTSNMIKHFASLNEQDGMVDSLSSDESTVSL